MNSARETFRKQAGLTLVEVLLALAIMGVALVGLIGAASRCLAVARKAKLYEEARHLLARAELENPIDKEEIEPGSERGTFDGQDGNYTWMRTIEDAGDEEGDGLYRIEMRVIWSQRGHESFEEVVTYLYQPKEEFGGSFESGP